MRLRRYERDFDFDSLHTQLDMMPHAIQSSGTETGQTVSSVASAMNPTPVPKALLPEEGKLLKLFYNIPVSTASAERCLSSLHCLKSSGEFDATSKVVVA